MTSEQQAELEQYRKAAREYHESVERRLRRLEDAEGVNILTRMLAKALEERVDAIMRAYRERLKHGNP